MLAAALATAVLGAASAGGAPAQDADPVPALRGRAATVAARRRVVDPRGYLRPERLTFRAR